MLEIITNVTTYYIIKDTLLTLKYILKLLVIQVYSFVYRNEWGEKKNIC